MRAAIQPPLAKATKPEPMVWRCRSPAGATALALTAHASTFTELATLRTEFVAPGPGIVVFEGEITVGGAAAASAYIRPAISQASGPKPLLAVGSSNERYSSLAAGERKTIPFRIALDVHEDISPSWVVKLADVRRCNAGEALSVYRYLATATFIPAESGNRYRRFTATGGTGAGAMTQTYPA